MKNLAKLSLLTLLALMFSCANNLDFTFPPGQKFDKGAEAATKFVQAQTLGKDKCTYYEFIIPAL